jgi:hypothetical protein
MTSSEWRALIEAYLDGRLSADAFTRRFLEASRTAQERIQSIPSAIEGLRYVVEAYDAGAAPGDPLKSDETELRRACEAALMGLSQGGGAPRTFDRARAREDMRRFTIQMTGCAGMGCAIAFLWLALCLLQIFAVSDQIQAVLDWPAAPATFAGIVLAFIPIIGNALAFFGAKDQWGWDIWLAALVFFAAPAATLFSGWSRWRRYGR